MTVHRSGSFVVSLAHDCCSPRHPSVTAFVLSCLRRCLDGTWMVPGCVVYRASKRCGSAGVISVPFDFPASGRGPRLRADGRDVQQEAAAGCDALQQCYQLLWQGWLMFSGLSFHLKKVCVAVLYCHQEQIAMDIDVAIDVVLVMVGARKRGILPKDPAFCVFQSMRRAKMMQKT